MVGDNACVSLRSTISDDDSTLKLNIPTIIYWNNMVISISFYKNQIIRFENVINLSEGRYLECYLRMHTGK